MQPCLAQIDIIVSISIYICMYEIMKEGNYKDINMVKL